jgi:hypothetical protein
MKVVFESVSHFDIKTLYPKAVTPETVGVKLNQSRHIDVGWNRGELTFGNLEQASSTKHSIVTGPHLQ